MHQTNHVKSYLDMKHALPRQTRARLAKLLYEMTIMPGMDPALIELWSTNCVRLIRLDSYYILYPIILISNK
jgi:proteasome activator subunit 4